MGLNGCLLSLTKQESSGGAVRNESCSMWSSMGRTEVLIPKSYLLETDKIFRII